MSDIFERKQQQNFFQTHLPGNEDITDPNDIRHSWNEKTRQQREYREQLQNGPLPGLSLREYRELHDWVEEGHIEDDDVYKMVSSKNLSQYLSENMDIDIPASMVFEYYDEFWQAISDDRQNRFSTPKSRYEAFRDSVQIAKNMTPLGKMGLELQDLHNKLTTVNGTEKEALQKQADELWKKIQEIQNTNAELGKRMPKDALTTIITSTVQSAPFTGKAMAGGAIGGVIGGVGGAIIGGGIPGFAAGARMGSRLGSFITSSSEMSGLMYVDLLAAGVEQKNAATLSVIGGGIQGLIEVSLGVVPGLKKAIGKTALGAAGKVLSQETIEKIAANASKNFITKITQSMMTSPVARNAIARSVIDTAKQAAGEGLEEGLQFLTEQVMLALGDAFQDAPVKRDEWFSPEFNAGLRQSIVGGLAGGIGFGIVGLPLNITGNVTQTAKQTTDLKNLAVTIDNKEEFRAAAMEVPITKNLSDAHLDQIYDSQESERQSYHQAMREQAARRGESVAALPTLEAPGEMRRKEDGRLDVVISSPKTTDDTGTGTITLYDSEQKNHQMGSMSFDYDVETNKITIEEINISQAITNTDEVIGDMIKELAFDNPLMDIDIKIDERMNKSASVDIAALKENLIAANPRGAEKGLQYYNDGDSFYSTKEMNDDIQFIAKVRNVSYSKARNDYEVMNTAFRKFGLNTHKMIEQMGLTNEKDLRAKAAEDPKGVESEIVSGIDNQRIAAQKIKEQNGEDYRVGGGFVAIKRGMNGERGRVLYRNEAMKEAMDRVQGITVITKDSNAATLLHEWIHFMVSVVIPNSPRYKKLLEDAVSKEFGKGERIALEEFTEEHHEWIADNWEKYLKTGEAPTAGLRALFNRIAQALKELLTHLELNQDLREFFDELLAGPDGDMLTGNTAQGKTSETKSRARVKTDNEQQKAYAEMTEAERTLQSDLHSAEEKAEILFAMVKNKEAEMENNPIGYLKANAENIKNQAERESVIAELDRLEKLYPPETNKYLAPNGNQSNLNHAQWYAVRTKNFKEWFGDWENLIYKQFLDGVPIQEINTDIAPTGGYNVLTQWATELFEKQGGKASNPIIGDVVLDNQSVRDSLAHGKANQYKRAAFAVVKDVIEKGKVIHINIDKGRKSYFLAAPVNINEKTSIVVVLAHQRENDSRFYLHAVGLKESLLTNRVSSNSQNANPSSSSSGDIINILQNIMNVNPDSVSKATDKNEEPLIVYHGTPNRFDVFDRNKGKLNDAGWLGEGHYFSADFSMSAGYTGGRGHIMELFLNIKEPYFISEEERSELVGRDDRNYSIAFSEELKSEGYDGVYYNGDLNHEWMVFNSNQIKSTTDNAGSYDPSNPSILFQLAYHGSPYRFDRFDSSHMGSGEGNQTFGYGLYFAGKKDIAEFYRNTLASRYGLFDKADEQKYSGRTMLEWNNYFNKLLYGKSPAESQPIFDKLEMLENLLIHYDFKGALEEAKENKLSEESIEWFEQTFKDFQTPGQLYEVDIPDNDELLNLDKNFNEQSVYVKTALKNLFKENKNPTPERGGEAYLHLNKEHKGSDIYNEIANVLGSAKKASQLLLDFGIKGNQYLDQTSRLAGEGSHNYVIFDDSEINITKMLFQLAYHGSANHFTRFDNKYMGKGVGAQAFGYGQYLTKSKDVADDYRRQLADTQFFVDGKQIKADEADRHLFTYTAAVDGTLDNLIKDYEEQLADTKDTEQQEALKKEIKLAKSLKKKNVESKQGQLYKVSIPDDDVMLLWDKELKSQPKILKMIREQAAKEDIDNILNYRLSGGNFYQNELSKMLGSQREASLFLNRAGVKGNKHYDKRDEANNYVIFDEAELQITQMLFQLAYHGSPYTNDLNRANHFQHGYGRTFYSEKDAAEWAQNSISKIKGIEGQLHNAYIPDDASLLHWDNTIAKQPEAVRKVAESLITWNKDGKSEFNTAYNLRKFNDGSYGFFRSIDGKAKWGTIEEAQAAAREEIKKTLTGESFYNTLAERIGKKETSLLLDHLGVKGTKYFDKNTEKIGIKKGYNYVIYGDSEVEIILNEIKAANAMLFQLTREEIHASALRYSSWQAWKRADDFAECYDEDASFLRDNKTEEPQNKKEIEEWYEKQWNEAQVLSREAALKDTGVGTPANAEAVDPELLSDSYLDEEADYDMSWDPELYEEEARQEDDAGAASGYDSGIEREAEMDSGNDIGNEEIENKPITTSEANRRLIEKLPQVIDDFILVIGRTMRENLKHFGAETEEDVTVRDQIERDQKRIFSEVHQYLRALALRTTTGKKLNDKQRRTAMSHMRRSLESGAAIYRELYTTLTEDPQFVSYAKNEIADKGVQGEAQRAAKEANGLTAFQRTKLAENIIDKDISKRIRAGIAASEEIEDYIERRNEEIKNLDEAIKQKTAELEKSKGETEDERAEAEQWRIRYHKIGKELQAAKKEAERLQIKIEKAKLSRMNAAARAKAGRENSEAKLKEKLAAKREEIKTLRKQHKENIAYAKKEGKLQTAWKWAEERQKLAKDKKDREKKIADRKAAKKYLEANKKLTSWIMSSDRIGMNVWIRQRELILGLQNALFYTSVNAAEALQLDAQITQITKKLERVKRKKARAKDEEAQKAEEWKVEQLEKSLDDLQSRRNQIEITPIELSEMKVEQAWEGSDTIDTGTIVYNGKTMTVEQFRKDFFENKIRYGFMDSKLRKALRGSAPSAKSLGEKRKKSAAVLAKSLSQEDLLAIKAVMQQLNKEGRANWERRQFAVHFEQQEKIKLLLFQQDELLDEDKKTSAVKRYKKAMEETNIEERKKMLAKGEDLKKTGWETWDDKRLMQYLDGDRKRALYKFITEERIRYANRRDRAVDQRVGRILDMLGQGTAEEQEAEKNLSEYKQRRKRHRRAEKAMKELKKTKITIEGIGPCEATRRWEYDAGFSLQEADTIFEAGTDIELSLADLMFLSVALDNKFSREHFLFGNLWSKDEQAYYERFIKKDGTMLKAVKDKIDAIGKAKEAQIRKAIEKYIEPRKDLTDIIKAIRDDFEAHFPETRATFEDMFNQSVEGQDNYLPIVINEEKHANAEKQDEIEALTMGSHQVKINPNDGMMHVRVDIGATHQTAIETDIFNVFYKGVEREEHFNKFAPYVRDLNTVLRGRNNNSKQLASFLKKIYGKWAVDRMYKHINTVGLPPSAKLNNAMENASSFGKLLAGNASVAYIAFNIPAWLAQYPNSIAAFFGKADTRFILSSLFEVMKPGNDLVERVFEKSPKVKNRTINVADEFRKHLEKQPGKLKEVQAKFIEIGMMGQRHADRTMVAAGWWALYQTALKEGKSEEDAIVYADEITAETQPDLNALETSPMFKDEGLGKLFLRFLQPLNMVWQNMTYDSFISREKSFGSVVARLTAYGTAALVVAAARGAFADKDDDEQEKAEIIRKVFFYMMFAQFTESVPLIGSAVSGTVEGIITGEGTFYQQRYFDLAQRLLKIPGHLTKGNSEKAIWDAVHVLSLHAGLPISQINRIRRAIQNEDPRVIFGFDPY